MDALKAGAKYEFNFGRIDFSKGVRLIEVNCSIGTSQTVNLLSGVSENKRPILHSKNDFIEFLAIMEISSSFAEVETGRFVGHSNVDFNGTGKIGETTTISLLVGYVLSDNNEATFQITSDGQEPIKTGGDFNETKNHEYTVCINGKIGTIVKLIVNNEIKFTKVYDSEKVLNDSFLQTLINDDSFKNNCSQYGSWSVSNGKMLLKQAQKLNSVNLRLY